MDKQELGDINYLISGNINKNKGLITNFTHKVKGSQLPREEWITLNRERTGYSRCGYWLHKWNKKGDPKRDCED